jgi:von Willebrand factor type A domain
MLHDARDFRAKHPGVCSNTNPRICHQRRSVWGAGFCKLSIISALLALAPTAPMSGQTTRTPGWAEYSNAVAQAQPADRIRQLQWFAWKASGPLRTDALELVVWEYLRVGDHNRALTWARELQTSDSGNALALAMICDGAQSSSTKTMKPAELLVTANHGMIALPRLRRPMGMKDADFVQLRRQAQMMLERAAGYAELQNKDYASARDYLRQVVGFNPKDAQSVYLLGLADISGRDANPRQGYWELARAAHLAGNTPQARQIAQFGRTRYINEGGSNAGWDQFLLSASATNSITSPAAVSFSRVASAPAPSRSTSQPKTTAIAKSSVPRVTSEKSQPKEDEAIWADDTPPQPPIIRKRRTSSGPMSLGILIETSLTGKDTRPAVADALTDMVRHMGDDDEAFVLTYDNHLVFEQDLTNDPKQLDEAMHDIKPKKGADLDEAVAFAAEHLNRIAKNPNRVLLVISDGRNVDKEASPARTSARINAAGVRIYCIGMDVDQTIDRYHLQALSSSTGGRSSFIYGSGQFRKATEEIAENIGIDFRF